MDKIFRNKLAIILFISPALLLFTAILLIPICQTFYYSLCDWNALTSPKFVAFDNFKRLFIKDKIMRTALKNSLFFMLFSRKRTNSPAERKRKRYCLVIKDGLSLKSTVKSVLEMKLWKRELMEDNRYDQKKDIIVTCQHRTILEQDILSENF